MNKEINSNNEKLVNKVFEILTKFKDWIWLDPELLPEKAISFKKDVYSKINEIFIPMIKNFNASNFN